MLQETVARLKASGTANGQPGETPLQAKEHLLREKKDAVIRLLREGLMLTDAAEKIGVRRVSVYDWMKADKAFQAEYTEFQHRYLEKLEAEVDRRAFAGVEKPVFQGGKEVGKVREYSDILAIFRLKALAPDKYRDNINNKVSGEVVVRVEYEPLPSSPSIPAIEGEATELPVLAPTTPAKSTDASPTEPALP